MHSKAPYIRWSGAEISFVLSGVSFLCRQSLIVLGYSRRMAQMAKVAGSLKPHFPTNHCLRLRPLKSTCNAYVSVEPVHQSDTRRAIYSKKKVEETKKVKKG